MLSKNGRSSTDFYTHIINTIWHITVCYTKMISMANFYLFIPVLLFHNSVTAQVPVDQEPHHKVVFENEYIRLIDGHIPAQDTTLAHTHAANSVVVFLSKSTFGIQDAGEKPVVTQVNPGDMVYRSYGEKPVNHTVWDQGIPVFHFLVVELVKQHSGDDTCSNLSQPGMKWQWQEKLVSAYKLDIREGQHYHLPKSNCAWLLIDISGVISAGSPGSIHSLQANDFVFFPPQRGIEIKCRHKEAARCVLLELK
jgi:hypothetical protein